MNQKINENLIPEVIDDLGKYWNQPDREDIEIQDNKAIMPQDTYDQLYNYETTNPTSLYAGKMWRRGNILCFCVDFNKPEYVIIVKKEIIIQDIRKRNE